MTNPRVMNPRVNPPRINTQRQIQPNVMQRSTIQRNIGPNVGNRNSARVIGGARMRNMPMGGAGRATIRGQSFSVWRGGGYRIHRGNSWRTFVALSTLGALTVGAVSYYPYAYIAAPQPYCEGLTEDGCELRWQDVETLEGDVIGQCVSYCPWQ
ncbi:MAG TPA: hypothetical protein VNQ50_04770 [Xanthobacteraceae bacterium]|nr:hypothetical protein [Xanthobacteraceae bacterium]